MTVSNASAGSSAVNPAVWTIHRFNPSLPTQPPDFSQFSTLSDATSTSAATDDTATSSKTSGGFGATLGTDLKALLLDLQGSSAQTTPDATSTTATDTSGTDTGTGTGSLVKDLTTFFNDLTSGTGSAKVGHNHGPPPPPPDASDDQSGTATDNSTGTAEAGSAQDALLGYMAKALQNYRSSTGTSATASGSLAVSA